MRGSRAALLGRVALGEATRQPGSRILEVGCGPGTLWQEGPTASSRSWELTLSDASLGMARSACAAVGPRLGSVRFEVADACALPHAAGSFDWVVANHMLYHVRDRALALAEIRRVLRPGGCLFSSTLGGDSFQELAELVRQSTSRKDFWQEKPSDPFVLENAPAQLEVSFSSTELRCYEDALAITAVEPVLAYLGSIMTDAPFTDAELGQVGAAIESRIARAGVFRVRKSAGVFFCRRD